MAKLAKLVTFAKAMDHWKGLREFCEWEQKAGGPDPHMKVTIRMAEDAKADWAETAWRGLCYLGVYNVPCSFAIYSHFPWEKVTEQKTNFTPWLDKNWKGGITLRRERKCVRSAIKLGKYLSSAAAWLKQKVADHEMNGGWMFSPGIPPRQRYDFGWENVLTIYGMGRYVAIKFLEYTRRCLGVDCVSYDIRAKGGWSPREGLTLLWPEYAKGLMGEDTPRNVALAERLAAKTKDILREKYDTVLDWYNLQVLLCDYKQCAYGRRQFPGRSQDSEIVYDKKIAAHWGRCGAMYTARKFLFPERVLGELNGWNSVREELGDCLAVHSYMWSDLLYDYNKSKEDISAPYRWDDSRIAKKGDKDPPEVEKEPTLLPLASGIGPAGFKVYVIIPGKVYQRGQFRKLPKAKKADFLKRLGIICVVCTAGPADHDLVDALGENYIHIPLADGRVKESVVILEAAKRVGDIIEGGGKTLVHCQAGRNRSSLFSALLVVRLLGIPGKEAVALLRQKRPNALANEHFVRFLGTVRAYENDEYVLEAVSV